MRRNKSLEKSLRDQGGETRAWRKPGLREEMLKKDLRDESLEKHQSDQGQIIEPGEAPEETRVERREAGEAPETSKGRGEVGGAPRP